MSYSLTQHRTTADIGHLLANVKLGNVNQAMGLMSAGLSNPAMHVAMHMKGTIVETEKVDVPTDICFLLDISGSMAGAPARAMDEQLKWLLFRSELMNANDFVNINGFNSTSHLLMKATKVEKLTEAEVSALRIPALPSGGTQLWDAMAAAIDQRRTFLESKKAAAVSKSPELKKPLKGFVMLVLTDGESSGDHKVMMRRLENISREIPHFHLHILGINLSSKAEQLLQEVVSAEPKRCEFTNIKYGHGAVANAMEDSFKHFTQTITKVRHVIRKLQLDEHGTVKFVQHDVRPSSSKSHQSGHPTTPHHLTTASYGASTSAAKLGDCKFGLACHSLKSGGKACAFQHPRAFHAASSIAGIKPCQFGIECHGYKNKKCPYQHLRVGPPKVNANFDLCVDATLAQINAVPNIYPPSAIETLL